MSPSEQASLLDSLCRCLGDARRRYVLEYLHDSEDGTASFDALVDYVVEREVSAGAPDRQTVAIDLHHVQLPLLVDHGMVGFDAESETVRDRSPTEMAAMVEAR
ncbi:MAG: hypothetical protein ABEJ31_00505 [Haloarculaceae archaeon]